MPGSRLARPMAEMNNLEAQNHTVLPFLVFLLQKPGLLGVANFNKLSNVQMNRFASWPIARQNQALDDRTPKCNFFSS